MFVVLEPSGDEPLYLQIYRQVVRAVGTGGLPVGSFLPSTRQLARDLSINYHTVHRAYELLRLRGVAEMAPRGRVLIRRPDPLGPPDEWLVEWEGRCATLIAEAITLGMSRGEILRRWRALLERARLEEQPVNPGPAAAGGPTASPTPGPVPPAGSG